MGEELFEDFDLVGVSSDLDWMPESSSESIASSVSRTLTGWSSVSVAVTVEPRVMNESFTEIS